MGEFFRFDGEKFRPIFKTAPFEVCSLMSGKAKVVTFLKVLIDGFKQSAPQYFHKCPYFGLHSANNIMFLKSFLTIFPTGTFKLTFRFSDGDAEIFKILLEFTV